VNANRSHYESAAKVLSKAPLEWLDGVISRRVPIVNFADALKRTDSDVKVIVEMAQ
jgi:hypothetical protein